MGEIRMNTDKSTLKELRIGEKTAQLPIIQGGMGVGISRSSLAGAVAREHERAEIRPADLDGTDWI